MYTYWFSVNRKKKATVDFKSNNKRSWRFFLMDQRNDPLLWPYVIAGGQSSCMLEADAWSSSPDSSFHPWDEEICVLLKKNTEKPKHHEVQAHWLGLGFDGSSQGRSMLLVLDKGAQQFIDIATEPWLLRKIQASKHQPRAASPLERSTKIQNAKQKSSGR